MKIIIVLLFILFNVGIFLYIYIYYHLEKTIKRIKYINNIMKEKKKLQQYFNSDENTSEYAKYINKQFDQEIKTIKENSDDKRNNIF